MKDLNGKTASTTATSLKKNRNHLKSQKRREIYQKLSHLEAEVKRAEDLQINFKNFKETYQEELWGKMPKFAAQIEADIKDDLTAGLWEMVNSTIDVGVQLPQNPGLAPGIAPPPSDDYDADDGKDPNCPWYEEDLRHVLSPLTGRNHIFTQK